MNIYEKLAAITAELNAVAKNLKVGEGRSSYKAVGEADVLAAVKPLEEKYKVYSYPSARRIVDSDVLTTKKVYQGQENETSKFFMRVETTYRFVNTENPEEVVEVTTYGDGVDSGDKAPGKAMTYGDKYALLKAYKIITGDDPDQMASEETKINRSFKHVEYKCENCGAPIEDYFDGRDTIPAAALAKRAKGRYGKVLCIKCGKIEQKNEQGKALNDAVMSKHEDAGDRL